MSLDWEPWEEETEPYMVSHPDPYKGKKELKKYLKLTKELKATLPKNRWGNAQRKIINKEIIAVLHDYKARKAKHKSTR